MIWVKILILAILKVLAACLVIANFDSVVSSEIINNNKSENAHLLTSVYDAIKHNNQKLQLPDKLIIDRNLMQIGPPVLIAMDNRNKRNTNSIERNDYYYTSPQDSFSNNIRYVEDEPFISKSDTICRNYPVAKENEFSVSITQGMSSISSIAFGVGKIIFGIIAVMLLPFFILKAILIPFKILLGIKTITAVNTIFFGVMLWRFLRNLTMSNSDDNQDDDDVDDGASLPSLSNINQINSDFGEIGIQDVKRILKYVKEKDKDW